MSTEDKLWIIGSTLVGGALIGGMLSEYIGGINPIIISLILSVLLLLWYFSGSIKRVIGKARNGARSN